MRIEINPRSLLNLEHICEVLYKLHPSVLNELIGIERSLGSVLGCIDLNNPSLEEREFLADTYEEKDYSNEPMEIQGNKFNQIKFDNKKDFSDFLDKLRSCRKEDDYNNYMFDKLRKYIQLDTDEYIPMKISVEVEDPIIGKKVQELVRALEKTRAPEQFYLNKKEMDEDAYFAESYGLTMNEEQKKELNDFLDGEDVEGLKELLRKEKLYP